MARRAALLDHEPEMKAGDIRDLVTHHDVEIERFITDEIRERHPDHDFITEEHDHPESDAASPIWIIDPIDGTTNFVSAGSYFAVSVAHYVGTRPVIGVVYDVMADDLYVGVSGGGAYLNGRRLRAAAGAQRNLHESVVEASLSTVSVVQDAYGGDTTSLSRGVRAQRAYGSAAIGICRVAAGTLDVYISASLSVWDYAAAAIVLAEVGGACAVTFRNTGEELTRPSDTQSSPVEAGLRLVYHTGKALFTAAAHTETLKELHKSVFPAVADRLSGINPNVGITRLC
jgi:myo-inositol-1(or 4)-monophosphatase